MKPRPKPQYLPVQAVTGLYVRTPPEVGPAIFRAFSRRSGVKLKRETLRMVGFVACSGCGKPRPIPRILKALAAKSKGTAGFMCACGALTSDQPVGRPAPNSGYEYRLEATDSGAIEITALKIKPSETS